ncbi:MAG: hypothetical protein U5L45_15865 [Saprospiraceae bacterium]|nr:hypothetical protein [Saprospiraceae bacterium]
MCKNKGVGAMAANTPDWTLLAATALGAAGSNIIVNPICNAIWAKDPAKASGYAGYVKIGLGVAGLMYSDNEYVQAASLGVAVDGGSQLLRSKVKAFQGLKGGSADSDTTAGVGSSREIIDLGAEAWTDMNGTESDYAVSGSGGVN